MDGTIRPTQWDPFRELQREVGKLLDSLGPFYAWRTARHFPSLNVYDLADRFVLTAELPGITSDELELLLSGDAITLRGARQRAEQIPDETYRRQERPFGAWSRTFSLPGKIDPQRVTASLSLGVLTIVVPKAADLIPRQIAVAMVGT